MAKKKQENDGGNKVRVELRIDPEVYEPIAAVAEKTGVSVNQLVQGILRWAGSNAHANESIEYEGDAGPYPMAVKMPGCVWFGTPIASHEDNERGPWPAYDDVVFELDFTERRTVVTPPPNVAAGREHTKRKANKVKDRRNEQD